MKIAYNVLLTNWLDGTGYVICIHDDKIYIKPAKKYIWNKQKLLFLFRIVEWMKVLFHHAMSSAPQTQLYIALSCIPSFSKQFFTFHYWSMYCSIAVFMCKRNCQCIPLFSGSRYYCHQDSYHWYQHWERTHWQCRNWFVWRYCSQNSGKLFGAGC